MSETNPAMPSMPRVIQDIILRQGPRGSLKSSSHRLLAVSQRNIDLEVFGNMLSGPLGYVGRGKEILMLFHERASQNENVKLLAELQEDDLAAEELRERQRACLPPKRTANTDSIAVARKLTLMSELNPTFLADHRLWKWVEEAREQNQH
ncbi:unnamed protein product [Fusarium fujikuroi]|uniref:Uncharacterized protein n=1 Tax=Fusarium fujikuroi TaxID=5127 RepID=A0A9Q9U611_FUSFU|nr:unnamed protein product [Fusarium fujikuroi]VTT60202.1 unnamed protein product [Fusarium fujikuroi]VZH91537.1 unnamed protein product [Fusarium fujikuroi]